MPLPIFPEDISETFTGGPNYNTSIVTKSGGREIRNKTWVHPRYEYDFGTEEFDINEVRKVVSFFHGARGRWATWLLLDVADFEAFNEPIGTGDGELTEFQAGITYNDTENFFLPYFRPLKHLKTGSVSAQVNGATVTVISHVDGVITLSEAPALGAAVTATFQFYVPCRFGVDKPNVEVRKSFPGAEGLGKITGLSAVEVRT